MKTINLITTLIFVIFSANAFAYGGGSSSKKACQKPKLSQFTPTHLSVVTPQSEFSFLASTATNPKSITVSIKKQDINTSINKTSKGYTVTAKLPASLQSSYARVNIKVKGTNNCPATHGWLLKIEE